MTSRLMRLWSVDMRQSARDPITALTFFVPLIMGIMLRFAVPIAEGYMPEGFSLLAYVDVLMAMMVLVPALITGMIASFLMLDEKDEGTLIAIQVTPLPRSHYLMFRLISPVVLSFVLTVLLVLIANLVALTGLQLAAVALLSALGGPLWAFFILRFASNKIEGMAVAKLMGMIVGLPLLSLFIPAAYHFVLWPVPFFWPYQVLLSAVSGAGLSEMLLLVVAGLVVHLIYLTIVFRLARRR